MAEFIETTEMIPPADDTYFLGSDTKGWKGIKFPDLKLYQLDVDTLSLENLAGDTYKNIRIGAGDFGQLLFDNETNVTHVLGLALNVSTYTTEAVTLRAALYPSATVAPSGDRPLSAIDADLRIRAANTQDWAAGILTSFNAWVGVETGATGTIAEIVHIKTSADIDAATVTDLKAIEIKNPAGAGTVTNVYGLYINALTKGATLNTAIYVAGGKIDFAGINGIDFTPGSDVDTDLLTLAVTGTPRMYWEQAQAKFHFTTGIWVDGDSVFTSNLVFTSGGANLQIAGNQVVAARVVNAGIDDAIEAGFTALYPNASAVLAALQAGIQTHGLITVVIPKDFTRPNGKPFQKPKEDETGRPLLIRDDQGKPDQQPRFELEPMTYLDTLSTFLNNIFALVSEKAKTNKEIKPLQYEDSVFATDIFRAIHVAGEVLELENAPYDWLVKMLKAYGVDVFHVNTAVVLDPLLRAKQPS